MRARLSRGRNIRQRRDMGPPKPNENVQVKREKNTTTLEKKMEKQEGKRMGKKIPLPLKMSSQVKGVRTEKMGSGGWSENVGNH